MSAANETQTFLGSEATWSQASLELDDIQALFGGRRIITYGTGQVIIQIISPDQYEQRYELMLTSNKARRFLLSAVEQDLGTIKPAERPGRPDEARLTITLTNAEGKSLSVSKWAGVANVRFDALWKELIALEKEAVRVKPIYQGKFDHQYRPKRDSIADDSEIHRKDSNNGSS